jgi:hypothetical protein
MDDQQPQDQLLTEIRSIAWNESIWHVLAVFSLGINAILAAGLGFTEWKTETRLRSLEAQLSDYQGDKWKIREALENAKTALNRTKNQEVRQSEIMVYLDRVSDKLRAK